jgi:hypothetical protein
VNFRVLVVTNRSSRTAKRMRMVYALIPRCCRVRVAYKRGVIATARFFRRIKQRITGVKTNGNATSAKRCPSTKA